MKDFVYKILNRFCFSKHHDSDCNGCLFKKCKTCPVAHACELLLKE